MKTISSLIASAFIVTAAMASSNPQATVLPGVSRTDLMKHDLSIPGHEVVQARVDIEPGTTSAKHSHPGEELVYVIEGTLEYWVEGQQPVTLKAGDVLFVPAGAVHSAKNVGADNGAELATYILEKGKPPITVVE